MSEQIRREFTLNVPTSKLHQALNDTIQINNTRYLLKSKNEAFGSYSISIIKNLYVLAATVTVKSLPEGQSHMELSAIPGPQLQRMPGTVTAMIDEFLQVVGDFATGKLVIRPLSQGELVAQNKKTKNALIFMLLLLLAIGVAFYFVFFN